MIVRAALAVCVALALASGGGGCDDGNQAPSLALVLDQQVVVGETLRLVLTASDPDGDRVSFDVDGLPDAAQVTARSKSEAVVVWSPLITDTQPGGRRYEVSVAASDGRGGVARQTIGVVVYPTFGVPTFNLPAGVVLNLADEDDLALLVEVKDDDSTDLTVEMSEGPVGAKLQRNDAKSAYFYWKPDDLQREVAVHRAIFRASDESHAPVEHVLTLVLLNAEKQSGCEGTPPTVAHGTPADQALAGPLVLTATATDAQSQVQALSLHWSRDPDGNFAAHAFERDAPNADTWTASLDVGAIPEDGALVHYYLSASDNDDPTGVACDRSGRYPKTGYYTAAVYPAGAPTTACVDDAAEPDGDPLAAPALKAGTYPGRRLCGDDLDFVKIDATPGTTAVAAITWNPSHGELVARLVDGGGATITNAASEGEGRLTLTHDLPEAGQEVWVEVGSLGIGDRTSYTLELAIEATRCVDDPAEDDSSPELAKALGLGGGVEQKVCPGDSDFFRVPGGAPLTATLAFDHRYGDLDLELRGPDGVTVLALAASEQSLETIDFTPTVETGGGDLYLRVYGVEGAANAYTLSVEASSGVDCTADGLGDATSPNRAAALFQGVYEGFVTCADAPDWFTVEINGGERVDLLALSETGPFDLSLYDDPLGAPLETVASDGDGFAEAAWERATASRLYYRIAPQAGGAPVTYALLQEIVDPPGACQPDRLEPSSASAPAPLSEGTYSWLRLCGMGDTDAFTFELDAFATLVVITAHAAGEQYTDLEVLAPDGTKLWEATDFGDGAYLEEVAEVPGTYTVIVRPFDVTALGYDLAVFLD